MFLLVRAVQAALLPHPIVAPVALPSGEPAFTELQIEPVAVGKQAAAAIAAEGEEYFVARKAANIIERDTEREGGFIGAHAKG